MGKLHKLRRAIEREPERWIVRVWDGRVISVRGAYHVKSGWRPSEGRSYGKFVKKTLQELGKLPG
jgi:hypothetical protein